jgi:hypothetical protein
MTFSECVPDVRPRQREPRRKSRGLRHDQIVDLGNRTPSPPAYFVCGWYRLTVPLPDEYVQVLSLD